MKTISFEFVWVAVIQTSHHFPKPLAKLLHTQRLEVSSLCGGSVWTQQASMASLGVA